LTSRHVHSRPTKKKKKEKEIDNAIRRREAEGNIERDIEREKET